MSIKLKMRLVSHPKVTLLCSLALMALAEGVFAFANGSAGNGAPRGVCLLSQQLHSSVAMRRLYLVRLEKVLGQGNGEVAAMYASVEEASYDAGAGAPGRFWSGGEAGGGAAVLDPFSAECISCHDGVNASGITVDLRNRPYDRGSRVTSRESDHPIGMDYDSYVNAGRGYNRITSNGNRMLFVNGKVGCLTCHDPLNPEKGHLVMSDRHSALCTTCHNK